MKSLLLVFGLLPALASATCIMTSGAEMTYRSFAVGPCGRDGGLCVSAQLLDGTRLKERLGDEFCDSNALATCVYRSESYSVRMFLPCAVRPVNNCAAIFNIYSLETSQNLASCQN